MNDPMLLAVVGGVGTFAPISNHIKKAHAIQHEEEVVHWPPELSARHLSDCVGLADEIGSIGDGRQLEVVAALASHGKGGTCSKARCVIRELTGTHVIEAVLRKLKCEAGFSSRSVLCSPIMCCACCRCRSSVGSSNPFRGAR
jgi:hypothetical protein